MRLEQSKWSVHEGWVPQGPGSLGVSPQLVLMFGSTEIFKSKREFEVVKKAYPKAHYVGCTTSGEIYGTQVNDESLVVTAIEFEHSKIRGAKVAVKGGDSYQAGIDLAQQLLGEDLVHVFVLSDGLNVNGTELVKGLAERLPAGVNITGGLSGDGTAFKETYVMLDDEPETGKIAALGIYGDRIKIGYGSLGGWDSFGPERHVTKSEGNVLYELDGQSALDLYKKYLGDQAAGLPSSGLLFPLSIKIETESRPIVRTLLAVNEKDHSMTFAGDVPKGAIAQLMKANFNRLVDGAVGAAKTSYQAVGSETPDLAILISCVGRKLVLKQMIEEEVEGVRDVLGDKATLAGFYSYGEISPFTPGAKCELHNQTMTITTFSEK